MRKILAKWLLFAFYNILCSGDSVENVRFALVKCTQTTRERNNCFARGILETISFVNAGWHFIPGHGLRGDYSLVSNAAWMNSENLRFITVVWNITLCVLDSDFSTC